jgi:hypothetical protein
MPGEYSTPGKILQLEFLAQIGVLLNLSHRVSRHSQDLRIKNRNMCDLAFRNACRND